MDVARSSKKRGSIFREVVETLVLTAVLFFVVNLAVQNFDVEGVSMEPRLHSSERVMVDKVSYLFHKPTRGDVVVFVAPPQPSENYVKRIIALPGDIISVKGGVPTVNGVTLHEGYIDSHRSGASPTDRPVKNLKVPPGQYFVMGDNRVDSYDSRSWGFLPAKNIIGRAALIYWPFGMDNVGFLPDVSSTFARVPQGQGTAGLTPFSLGETLASVEQSWHVLSAAFGTIDPLRKYTIVLY